MSKSFCWTVKLTISSLQFQGVYRNIHEKKFNQNLIKEKIFSIIHVIIR